MDQRIVKDFLVRAGRSYYRSPEFERERLTFARASADFDPCARFGIGFMSLFMLGDQIIIHTRRYGGSTGGLGEPLIVEVNGLGSLIVLRRGAASQPAGTSVLVVGRQKPARFATWNDRVRLVDTLYAYALAGEFPIHAKCSIPEIEDAIDIPTKMAEPPHPLVEFNVKHRAVFEQDFNEVDQRLRGKVATDLPVSENGALVVANSEAGWRQGAGIRGPGFFIASADKQGWQVWSWEGKTCIDGILVAGPQGRGRRGFPLVSAQYRNPLGFGEDLFVLDVRGDLKPELAPDRSPPESYSMFSHAAPSWRRLRRIAAQAHGRLWKKVIGRFGTEDDAKALWQLIALHAAPVYTLPRGFVWSHLLVPTISTNDSLFFRAFSQLSAIPFGAGSPKPFAAEQDGCRVGVDAEMDAWHGQNDSKIVSPILRSVVLSMATLALDEGKPLLEFYPPEYPSEPAFTDIVFDRASRSCMTVPFGRALDGVLAAVASERLLNKRHPIAAYLLSQQETVVDDAEFLFLHCLAQAVLEEGALEALASGDFSNRRFNINFSSLGFYFKNVDLAALKAEHRPPYRCWLPEKGVVEITEATLGKLAEVQAIDWHRRREPRFI